MIAEAPRNVVAFASATAPGASGGMVLRLVNPETGVALTPDGPHSLTDGRTRFPVVDGIPYLRTGRDALRAEALDRLDRGDRAGALIVLLADCDDHAKGPSPREARLVDLAAGRVPTLREAMAHLEYGPVADYFAHRWSTPTFLSALALLSAHWRPGLPVVEVACGIGQILREAQIADATAVGIDVVFSKLWLAQTYVLERAAALVCADAAAGLPLVIDRASCVICHDALYFLDAKREAVAAMRRLAGQDGALLAGHCHNRLVDQRGVGGTPLSPDEWGALMPDASAHDDATLTRMWLADRLPEPAAIGALWRAEALSFALGRRNVSPAVFGTARTGRSLRPNPMMAPNDSGTWQAEWPTASLAAEYADADYLGAHPAPDAETLAAAAAGRVTAETQALARRRVLLDLPEAW